MSSSENITLKGMNVLKPLLYCRFLLAEKTIWHSKHSFTRNLWVVNIAVAAQASPHTIFSNSVYQSLAKYVVVWFINTSDLNSFFFPKPNQYFHKFRRHLVHCSYDSFYILITNFICPHILWSLQCSSILPQMKENEGLEKLLRLMCLRSLTHPVKTPPSKEALMHTQVILHAPRICHFLLGR